MTHYLRPMLVFAATAGIASMLAGAAPALAADVSMTGGQPAVMVVKVLPSTTASRVASKSDDSVAIRSPDQAFERKSKIASAFGAGGNSC
jgi:hypothetical protein